MICCSPNWIFFSLPFENLICYSIEKDYHIQFSMVYMQKFQGVVWKRKNRPRLSRLDWPYPGELGGSTKGELPMDVMGPHSCCKPWCGWLRHSLTWNWNPLSWLTLMTAQSLCRANTPYIYIYIWLWHIYLVLFYLNSLFLVLHFCLILFID